MSEATDSQLRSATVTSRFIDTTQVKRAISRLTNLGTDGWKKQYCMGLLVIGPARVGKSHIAAAFRDAQNASDAAGVRTVVIIEVPEAVRLPSFLSAFLTALKDPYPSAGHPSAKTERIFAHLSRQQTKIIILDESQRLLDENRRTPKKDVVDWVVRSLNQSACPIAFFRTEAMLPLFEGRPHMEGRMLGQVDLAPFNWAGEDIVEFQVVLGLLEKELPLQSPSNLRHPPTAYRIWLATGGLFGMVSRLLDAAVTVAGRQNCASLTLEVLADTLDELRIGRAKDAPNPFRVDVTVPI